MTQRKLKFSDHSTVEDDGSTYLNTTNLPKILEDWGDELLAKPADLFQQGWVNARDSLSYASECLELLFDIDQNESSMGQPFSRWFGQTIKDYVGVLAMIGETIERRMRYLIQSPRAQDQGIAQMRIKAGMLQWRHFGSPAWDKDILTRHGWCAFVSYRLTTTFNSTAVEYASRFSTETGWASTKRHVSCTEKSCTVLTLPKGAKSCIKHDPELCQALASGILGDCGNETPDVQAVLDALRSGSYPLIEFEPTGAKLKVVRYIDFMPYFAISHVWAEGLGSYSEFGLPRCQIEHLSRILNRRRFWIDGLCIPELRDERKMAISRMAKIYQGCSAVIVIDASIGKLSRNDPIEEILLAINTSSWAQRLWTLQEGWLAVTTGFNLSDGILWQTDIIKRIADVSVLSFVRHLAAKLPRHLLQPLGKLHFSDIPIYMSWRDTNRSSDETLALGGLCGMDVSRYFPLSEEERMVQFLMDLGARGEVPSDMIFFSPARRLSIEGFRWAPRTFMGSPSKTPMKDEQYAVVTREGLKCQLSALVLRQPLPVPPSRGYNIVVGAEQSWFRFEIINFDDPVHPDDVAPAKTHMELQPEFVLMRETGLLSSSMIGALAKLEQEPANLELDSDPNKPIKVRLCGLVHISINGVWNIPGAIFKDDILEPESAPGEPFTILSAGVLYSNFLIT